MKRRAALVLFASALEACAADESPVARDAQGSGTEADPPGGDDEVSAGRDTSTTSCLAACQNSSLVCARDGAPAGSAFVAIGSAGCEGELAVEGEAAVSLVVECGSHRICVDGECAEASFSATSFAWGGTVCVRE